MARYIEETEIYKLVEPHGTARVHCSQIDELPRADVVPKSEYDAVVSAVDNSTKEFLKLHDDYQKAKREVDRLKYNLKAVLEEIPETKRELAGEIFAEIEKLHLHITNDFDLRRYAELKKKYTEGNQ